MSDNPARDVQKRTAIRSHLGIPESLKLVGWAKLVTAAWPTASVWITGSALERKDFRDIDVTVVLAKREDAGLDNGERLDSAWDLIASALSALAREMTGLPVEARLVWLGYGWHPADYGGYELSAAGMSVPASAAPSGEQRQEDGGDL